MYVVRCAMYDRKLLQELFDSVFVMSYIQNNCWIATDNIPAAIKTGYFFYIFECLFLNCIFNVETMLYQNAFGT